MRRRFANCLQWYQNLLSQKNLLVRNLVDGARLPFHNIGDSPDFPVASSPPRSSSPIDDVYEHDEDSDQNSSEEFEEAPGRYRVPTAKELEDAVASSGSEDEEYEQPLPHPSYSTGRRATVEEVEDEDEDVGKSGFDGLLEDLTRPSEYLRSRCPLCFGGRACHDPQSM